MKKSLLTLGLASLALSSFASTRILYQQNFETASDPTQAGWASYRGLMSIVSDDFGKFLEINQNGQNGGSTFVKWGQEIFLNEEGLSVLEDGTYNVHFEFQIKNSNCNQYNSAITVFTNQEPPVSNDGSPSHQPYRNRWSPSGYWQNYVFDASQVDDGTKDPLLYAINGGTNETESTSDEGEVTKTFSIDYSDPSTLAEGTWYVVDLTVNVETREVAYMVKTLSEEIIKEGTITVPETNIADGSDITMYAEGINLMLARANTTYDIDNIKVSFESEKDIANDPAVALTRIGKDAEEQLNLNLRAYTIDFLEGETLHVIGTDGKEETVDYADCDGSYVYETATSGVLKAWTTLGEATSSVVEVVVECVPVVLPAATATITSVEAGFGKTYTLTVSNIDVPLQPTLFIDYEFTGKSGKIVSEAGVASGAQVTVEEEGTLKLTSLAYGYQSTSVSVDNDLEFEVKKQWDFARMSHDEITAALSGGEWKVSNSGSTSGFNSWTGRQQLYYNIAGTEHENEEGVLVYEKYLPFGFVSEDNTEQVLNYCLIDRSAIAETTKGEYFEGLTIFPDRGKVAEGGLPNVGIIEHIGLFNDQTTNNNNNVIVHDLEATDFVYINAMGNYGRDANSNHPICSTTEEYYAQLKGATNVVMNAAANGVLNEETNLYDVTYALYRIDTALVTLTVFKQAGAVDAVEAVDAAVAGDNYWYSIDGVRVAEPTRPGLYIHNGKKIIVK